MAGPTIADLKTFCGEIASPDSSGATAEREFIYWINAALARLYAEHAWNHALEVAKITLVPQEAATGVTLLKGGASMVASTLSLQDKYINDWEFHTDAEPNQTFRIQSKTDPGIPGFLVGNFQEGSVWVQDNVSGGTGSWHQTVYDLPSNAKEVFSVRILDTRDELISVVPHKFDQYKMEGPKETGYPRFYTLRDDKIEIWPAPSADYYLLAISFRKGAPYYTTATVTSTEADWPIEWQDLLQKGIQLEAAITLGDVAPIKYDLAKMEFEERLSNYVSLDSSRDTPAGPMQLSPPTAIPRGRIFYDYGYGDGPLADE